MNLKDYLYYQDDWATIYCGDCLEILPLIDKDIDLLLMDPPYGCGLSLAFAERFSRKAGKWWKNTDYSLVKRHKPIKGDNKPFDPSPFLKFKQIITWGANWYASRLPDSGGWFVWDKYHGIEDSNWPMSHAELAWTNICQSVRIFRHRWAGLLRESERGEHWHPTQKPVELMVWCIQQAKDVKTILDPYMGSGPIAVAAKNLNRKCIAIEDDASYCEIAVKRLRQEVFDFR